MNSMVYVKASSPYEIHIGCDLFSQILDFLKLISDEFVIITDTNIVELYGREFEKKMVQSNLKVHILTFAPGEESKNRKTKEKLEDEMLQRGLLRNIGVIALGGGIVTDIAGFVAATYLRGVPAIYIPTSLLGMVDASMGGKTGVNTPVGKNLIGSFYQPKAIFMDIHFLQSLPEKELREGMVEVIKYALIRDKDFFRLLEKSSDKIKDPEFLKKIVTQSAKMKSFIVEQDEKEVSGLRQIINFGHTIGHALEQMSHYKLSHGEAIAIGSIAEAYLSYEMTLLKKEELDQIFAIFKAYGLPLQIRFSFSFEDLKKCIAMDKKAKNNIPHFVLLCEIGKVHTEKAHFSVPVPENLLQKTYQYINTNFKK